MALGTTTAVARTSRTRCFYFSRSSHPGSRLVGLGREWTVGLRRLAATLSWRRSEQGGGRPDATKPRVCCWQLSRMSRTPMMPLRGQLQPPPPLLLLQGTECRQRAGIGGWEARDEARPWTS